MRALHEHGEHRCQMRRNKFSFDKVCPVNTDCIIVNLPTLDMIGVGRRFKAQKITDTGDSCAAIGCALD